MNNEQGPQVEQFSFFWIWHFDLALGQVDQEQMEKILGYVDSGKKASVCNGKPIHQMKQQTNLNCRKAQSCSLEDRGTVIVDSLSSPPSSPMSRMTWRSAGKLLSKKCRNMEGAIETCSTFQRGDLWPSAVYPKSDEHGGGHWESQQEQLWTCCSSLHSGGKQL